VTEPVTLDLHRLVPDPPDGLLDWSGIERGISRRRTTRSVAAVVACVVVTAAIVVGATSLGGSSHRSTPPATPGAHANGPLLFAQVTSERPKDIVHPNLVLANSDGTGRRVLAHSVGATPDQAVTRDGTEVAYIASRNQDSSGSIRMVDIDGSDNHEVYRCAQLCQGLTWSPNGRELAFGDGGAIKVISRDGAVRTISGAVDDAAEPAWSPNGSQLAFSQRRVLDFPDNPQVSAIYVVDSDGNNLRKLTDRTCAGVGAGCTADTAPAWSPDSDEIAFSRAQSTQVETPGVFVMGTDGGQVHQLWACPTFDCTRFVPNWSPDGAAIAVVVAAVHTSVEVIDTDSDHGNVRIAQPGSYPLGENDDFDLTWSPDGKQLAFELSTGHERFAIFTADADGTDLRTVRLPLISGFASALAWAAAAKPTASDGPILFGQVESGSKHGLENSDLVAADSDGSHARDLTTDPGADDYAAVSPDGREVAYVGEIDPALGTVTGASRAAIYLVGIDGSDNHLVYPCGTDCRDLAWSPDGKSIAFADNNGIKVLSLDGSVRSVCGSVCREALAQPTWSPDGREIAFSQAAVFGENGLGEEPSAIFVINSDGTDLRKLTDRHCPGACTEGSDPAWSPNGREIAFSSSPQPQSIPGHTGLVGPGSGIYLMTSTGHDLHWAWPCPDDYCGPIAPRWSPDGSQLAFVSGSGRAVVKVLTLDQQSVATVQIPKGGTHPDGFSAVAWSPNGNQLALVLTSGRGSGAIYTANPDGTDARRLPLADVDGSSPPELVWAAAS
jgi:Tol biopolymer transport system component